MRKLRYEEGENITEQDEKMKEVMFRTEVVKRNCYKNEKTSSSQKTREQEARQVTKERNRRKRHE